MTIRVHKGDITKLTVDAIVNAANSALQGGSGVDGAIHRAAGPQLALESRRLAPCKTGDAKLTGGYQLPARFVIHTVGPVWRGGGFGEADLLESCYRRSLEVAAKAGATSVAFSCISTGIYGYPAREAAEIAVATVGSVLVEGGVVEEIVFCCFSEADVVIYQSLLEERKSG